MIVVLIVTIGPQAVLLVVMGIARHAFVCMDGFDLSANGIALLLLGWRRQRDV